MKDKSTIWGTAHFVNHLSAYNYYADLPSCEVDEKIKAGEISIGKPTVKSNEKLYLKTDEGRYFIGAK